MCADRFPTESQKKKKIETVQVHAIGKEGWVT